MFCLRNWQADLKIILELERKKKIAVCKSRKKKETVVWEAFMHH